MGLKLTSCINFRRGIILSAFFLYSFSRHSPNPKNKKISINQRFRRVFYLQLLSYYGKNQNFEYMSVTWSNRGSGVPSLVQVNLVKSYYNKDIDSPYPYPFIISISMSIDVCISISLVQEFVPQKFYSSMHCESTENALIRLDQSISQ